MPCEWICFLKLTQTFFRSQDYSILLRNGLQSSVENTNVEIAKLILEKLQIAEVAISSNPKCELYINHFTTLGALIKISPATKKERNIREKRRRDFQDYQKAICKIMQNDKCKDLSEIDPSNTETYDCPICFEFMSKPRQIFKCSRQHLVCSLCLAKVIVMFVIKAKYQNYDQN